MEEKKLKSLRLIAMAIAVVGSAVLLGSILLECFTFTGTAGNTTVSMIDFIGIKLVTALGLVEISLVFSLLNFAVPQIMVGLFTGIWAGLICREVIHGLTETTGYLSVRFGLGMLLFIVSACLILVSGILFAIVPGKYKGLGSASERSALFKKIEVFCTAAMGLSIVLFCVLELVKIRR